jgi:hypothetical protein
MWWSDNMFLYHGTNTKRLPVIKKQGLIPTAPKASSGEDFIYLTDKPGVAALFSGYGSDKQGFLKEGYMAPLEIKMNTGVVLKVKIDPKFLEDDQIWGKKVKELKNPNKLYKKIHDEILDEVNGNQVLEWEVENELHRMWKESGLAEEGEDYAPEEMSQEDWDHAIEVVVSKRAKKELKSILEEAKVYMAGKLYQYSEKIPPEDIVGVYPAKKFLKGKKETGREFGGGIDIQVM